MKNEIVVMFTMFTFFCGGPAWAADIFTPALNIGAADSVECRVLNTSTRTEHDVTINLRDGNNGSQASVTLDINGGSFKSIGANIPAGVVYCRVSGIPEGKARVALCVLDVNFTPIQCVTSP